MNKECKICKNTFKTKSSGKIYCGSECRKKGSLTFKLNCVECDKVFLSRQVMSKCCSDVCRDVRSKKYQKNRRIFDAEKLSNYSKDYYENVIKKDKEILEKRKEYAKKYYIGNKEKIVKYHSNRYDKNKKEINKKTKKYRSKNITKANRSSYESSRRAKKIQATPSWAEIDKIKIIYQKAKELEELTGLKYHVDHVIPLKGKNVCGLHVWANLQILEASVNLKKNNKFKEN